MELWNKLKDLIKKRNTVADWGAGQELLDVVEGSADFSALVYPVNQKVHSLQTAKAEQSSGQSRCPLSLLELLAHSDFHPSCAPRQREIHRSPLAWASPGAHSLKLQLLLSRIPPLLPSAGPTPPAVGWGGRAWLRRGPCIQRAKRARATKEPGSWRGEVRGAEAL